MQSLTIGVLGSHSALDMCRGAKDEGFRTLVIAQKNREKTYAKYYKSENGLGCVDECIIVKKFSDILKEDIQKQLLAKNTIFVPHRSFEAYLHFDYKAIEKQFTVPLFGNRKLLKIEERGVSPNQYDLLEKAQILLPKRFKDPQDIDRVCIVKVLEKARGFERAFFLVENYDDYKKQVDLKLSEGIFTKEQLEKSVIEEFVVGVQVNFNFFYSPLTKKLELLGTDTRRQTNIEGLTKIPVMYQQVLEKVEIKYEEAGHIAVTVLESLLELAFELAERFVATSIELMPPGVIGPFALQTIVTPGPPKKEIIVIDVSPRMPGSPGIIATPYTQYLYGKNISVGRRIAMEIKKAIELSKLNMLIT